MNRFRTALLATIATGAFATSAHAQVSIPAPGPNNGDNALHGAGASAIQNVLVQELNCVGANNQLGVSNPDPNGRFITLPAFNYAPPAPTASNPAFNCATQDVQPNFDGKYVATGSGFGRQMWRLFSAQFEPVSAGVNNPFVDINGNAVWTNLQFAFSEASASPSDITAYNSNANNATNQAGPAIQFPKYVLPVAVTYNPVYGRNASNANMRYNVRFPQQINGRTVGGLRLSREVYCKVFNGAITNFNDPLITAANNNITLQDTANDTPARWAADGVPIRLVGRLDRSGTTDLFTRHLAAVCDAFGTNKYDVNAESLPYARGGANSPNFSGVRPDTGYSPTSSAPLSGTINSISRDYFNGTAILSVANGSTSLPTGNVGSGLYLLGDGSGRVRDAIAAIPDYVLNGVRLNGKIAYIAADFIAGSPTAGANALFAAALAEGPTAGNVPSTVYRMPSARNAVFAFGQGATAILPPQANSAGAFRLTDTRQVRLPAGGTGNATRFNPLAWADVLYNSPNNSLAAPAIGYPITGTSQYLGYTCYKTDSNRLNIVNFLALNFGLVTEDSQGNPISSGLFDGTDAAQPGLLSQSNIGPMPEAWQVAISETFLKNSTQTSGTTVLGTYGNGGNGMWIQDKFALTATDVDGNPDPSDPVSNPVCTAGAGA